MPRRPRKCLPGIPSHVITRGNNHQACFRSELDYYIYIECLDDALERYKVSLHAYVFMTNHVHLLMTPETETGISNVMQSLGRRYVQYFNKRYQRSGTLWEGRYKSSLISDDRYVLACYRYIESNPVRARIVQNPGDYRWSSYAFNGYGIADNLVKMHDCYQQLGKRETRRMHYREMFETQPDRKLESQIRTAAIFSIPLLNKTHKSFCGRAK